MPNPKMGDLAFRMSLFEKSKADIEATGDAFVKLAVALHPMVEAAVRQARPGKAPICACARVTWRWSWLRRRRAAPDANSTLRVTYGQVKSVEPRDGMVWKPFTTVAGVAAKHIGSGEFNVPERQREAIRALRGGKSSPFIDPNLKDVPVDFLSTVDTTGGNSGSPTLNAKGDLAGLWSDGTYETVASSDACSIPS